MDPYIIFFGLAVGVLVGLTGVGGGSLMTPLLILRRAASDARRDAARPFRPRPADAADLESARVCREAVGR